MLPRFWRICSVPVWGEAAPFLGRLQARRSAFRREHEAHEVVLKLGNLVEDGCERQAPRIFVLDGDVHKADDDPQHHTTARALRHRDAPEPVLAAWAQGWRGMGAIRKISSGCGEGPIQRKRSPPQWDPVSPALFSGVVDTIAAKFTYGASRMGGHVVFGRQLLARRHPRGELR